MALKVSPEELAAFAAAPTDAMADDRMIGALLRVSQATVWRMRRDGRLPPPVKITARSVRTRKGDLIAAMAAFGGEAV